MNIPPLFISHLPTSQDSPLEMGPPDLFAYIHLFRPSNQARALMPIGASIVSAPETFLVALDRKYSLTYTLFWGGYSKPGLTPASVAWMWYCCRDRLPFDNPERALLTSTEWQASSTGPVCIPDPMISIQAWLEKGPLAVSSQGRLMRYSLRY